MYGLAVLLWPLAGLLFVLGAWMLSVSLIIREIRWMALEAAVARGDVVITEGRKLGKAPPNPDADVAAKGDAR
ncbi:hypothetical protein [Hyphomonas pacifica]|nr:hypothetical protein [Hyphomonas pacifica]